MNHEQYNQINALSNTGMSYLKHSPAHFQAWRNRQLAAGHSPAQQLGVLIHLATLEPEKFNQTCVPWNHDRRTKKGRESYEHLESQGKIVVKIDDWHLIQAVRTAVLSHPIAKHLIESSQHEVIKTWIDPISGAQCKGRADCVNNTFIADLKTVLNASPEAMSCFIARYEVHRQAAFYLDGFKKQDFFVIAVEKNPPYPAVVYRIPAHVISIGRECYQALARIYQHCIDNEDWPAYPQNILDLQLPSWAIPEDSNLFELAAA